MSLPEQWSELDKGPNITLGEDNLSLILEKDLEKAEFVRTSHPIPINCTHHYFEIQILCDEGNEGISMGLCSKSNVSKVSSSLSPSDILGLESNNDILSPEISYRFGNTIGCFVDFEEGFSFFTIDGKIAWKFSSFSGQPENYYPTVRLRSAGAIITARFKEEECIFKVTGM